MFIATIEGKEVELSPEQIKGKSDGFAIVTPENVPSGFVKQDAVDRIVSDRVNKTKEKVQSELLEKTEFHEQILSKYNVTLKDGKAVGVEQADVNEIKREAYLKAQNDLETKYKPAQGENKRLKARVIETELKSAAIQAGVKPTLAHLVVKSYSESFDIDKDGNVFEKDKEGFKMGNDGNFVTAETYFKSLKTNDSYKDFFEAKTQTGSGAQGSGNRSGFSGITKKTELKNAYEKSQYIKVHGFDSYQQLKD